MASTVSGIEAPLEGAEARRSAGTRVNVTTVRFSRIELDVIGRPCLSPGSSEADPSAAGRPVDEPDGWKGPAFT
jgi:hypothetical protein